MPMTDLWPILLNIISAVAVVATPLIVTLVAVLLKRLITRVSLDNEVKASARRQA